MPGSTTVTVWLEPPSEPPERVAIVLVPGFSLMAYASTLEPLRAANRIAEAELYAWTSWSMAGGPLRASNEVQVLTEPLDPTVDPVPDLVMVCAGIGGERYRDRHLEAALRLLARRGARIGAVSTGSFILARAGLLEGYRCTVHWEYIEAFERAFPHIEVVRGLYVIDRDRLTCAGGTAPIDLMLELLRRRHGGELAARVTDEFVYGRGREADEPQRLAPAFRHRIHHPALVKAVEIMERNLERPLSTAAVARRTGLSARQLERLFKKHVGRSPARFYLDLRLERARRLLRGSTLSITEVAFACGFETVSHFARCYRARFGLRPSEERREAATAAAAAAS